MKFTRTISLALISALSVGTLVAVAEVNKAPVNRTFNIDDLAGDRSVLEAVTLENVIKTGNNSFEKVYLNNGDVLFEKTQFDLQYGVGEEILAHKDLYRGMNYALKLETDTSLLAVNFNRYFPYASTEPYVEVAKKDKNTNEIMKEKIVLTDISLNEQIMREAVLEIDDTLYYCMTVGDRNGNSAKNTLRIYEINPKTLQLQIVNATEIALTGDYANVSNIVSDGENIYTILSNDTEYKLAGFNSLTKEVEVIDLLALAGGKGYVNYFNMDKQSIFVQTDDSLLIIDRDTLKVVNKEAAIPSSTNDYDFVYVTEQIVKDDMVFVLYGTYSENRPSEQLLVTYNVEDGSILYEGKLPSMVDRGTGIDFSFAK